MSIASAWRWFFVLLAIATSLFLIGTPGQEWLPVGARIPANLIWAGMVLNLVSAMGVLLRRKWGFALALIVTAATLAVASWTFFGYPKHSPQGGFIAIWLICLTFQLSSVRNQFFSETK